MTGDRTTESAPRAWCPECRRAQVMCCCALVEPIAIGFELAVLMHPREARVAIGTGRLLHRMVRGSHLVVGEVLDDDRRLASLLARPELAPLVLFPRDDAVDLDRATLEELRSLIGPGRAPLVLIPDGTWTTAKRLVRVSERLSALPALRFSPPRPSRYGRLRKEPGPDCWSTLESAHHVIDRFGALGLAPPPPDRAHDRLLVVMDEVVARQLAYEPLPADRA